MKDLLQGVGIIAYVAFVSWFIWVLTAASPEQVVISTIGFIVALFGLGLALIIALPIKVLLEKRQKHIGPN